MFDKLKSFFKSETVLCVAVLLALLSSLAQRPSLSYIDWDVLSVLLSLMLVVAGLKSISFLDWLALELLQKLAQRSASFSWHYLCVVNVCY